jgi:hypothetical protein
MKNLTGVWKGYYTYNKKYYKNKEGVKNHFTITIENVSGNSFSGKVEDDAATGGTSGVGRVEGKVKGDKIEFIKKMPVHVMFDGEKRILEENKSHPNIYYSGILSDNKVKAGKWRFRRRIFFSGGRLFWGAGNGEWAMEKVSSDHP